MIKRILSNTIKQVLRSKWTGWASVSVMVLAFLIGSIFGGLAYFSNLYIKYIESKSNILVFFEIGMDPAIIKNLQTKWSQDSRIKNITYETEESAYNNFSGVASVLYKEEYDVLKNWKVKKLQSNLDVQIYSLAELKSIETELQTDINAANKGLVIVNTLGQQISTSDVNTNVSSSSSVVSSSSSQSSISNSSTSSVSSGGSQSSSAPMYKYSADPTQVPIYMKVDDKSLDQLRQVLYTLRITGIVILSMLFIVIFFFTFLTVEFRIYNQTDEIGVMQLVGGSLFFIRSPYILEGGFYGIVGSLISSTIIGATLASVFVLNKSSAIASFFYDNFSNLPWPHVTKLGWVAIIGLLALLGFAIGSLSSYVSIRRYIR